MNYFSEITTDMLWNSARRNKRIMEYFPVMPIEWKPNRTYLINTLNTMFQG